MHQTVLLALAILSSASAAKTNFVAGACAEDYAGEDAFPHKTSSGEQFRDTVAPDYSLHWNVDYHPSYKILTNAHTGAVHVLHQCGAPPPAAEDVPAGAVFVQVPVTAAATTSTTYIPLIEQLGERAALKAYGSSFDYVSSPCLRKMYRDGQVQSAYDSSTWTRDDALIESLGVELTVADEWSSDAPSAYVMTDTHEAAPNAVLKTAEYVEVVGLFFNREKEATEVIERVIANYLCTRDAAEAALDGRAPVKVMWSSFNAYAGDAGGWSIPSGSAWYAELIAAAGGELLLADGVAGEVEDSWGYTYLSTAQAEALAGDAAVWISPGPWDDSVALDAPPVVEGRVFDNQGPRGPNDWFERRVVEPDTMLQDLAVALHPDAFVDVDRKWLRDVSAGEEVGGVADADLDEACPDVAAPYVFESADLCAGHGGGSKKSKKKDQSAAIGAAVGVTLVVVAAVLLTFWCLRNPKRPAPTHPDSEIKKSASKSESSVVSGGSAATQATPSKVDP